MKYWLISDPHFYHEMMIRENLRPADYADRIFKGLSAIPADDILICLGDITIGKDEEIHDKYIRPLKCKKILVKGNHDGKSNNWYLEHGWNFVCFSFSDTMFGKRILFTHKPTKPSDGASINIHGHLHTREHRDLDSSLIGKCFLVSCELQGYQPQTVENFLRREGLFV